MKSFRMFGSFIASVLLVSQTAACKKRNPGASSGDGATQGTDTSPNTAVVVDAPKNLPPNTRALPQPPKKPWAEKSLDEKRVQISYWLNQHQYGDATQKAKVVSEMNAANLSAAEKKDFEETRQRFGYGPVGQ